MSAPTRPTPDVAAPGGGSAGVPRPTRKRSTRGSGGTGHGNRPSPTRPTGGLRLIGYVRVSTASQAGDRSHGLDAQTDALRRWCAAEGHTLVTVVPEVASTRDPARMYSRLAVEALLKAGVGDAMAVRALDRASRGTLDTDDPEQELMVNIRLSVAQEERRLIARRTREGLEAARSRGAVLGRPRSIPDAVVRRMRALRRDGLSCARIAARLDAGKTPPPNGGTNWSPATVRTVLKREGAL